MQSDIHMVTEEIRKQTQKHPCYNGCNHENARMHLPVAPNCNIQCNYCVRKFDCMNESRPGVTTKVLTPLEGFEKYMETKKKMPNLSVVGIAGPGDALCDFEKTKETLDRIRAQDKEIMFCLSTNGLLLPEYANDLIQRKVNHVTVTLNSVSPIISSKIYKYITYQGKQYTKEEAGAILLENQLEGILQLTKSGVICKINIVMLQGINDLHIPKIVEKVRQLGCYMVNIMPFIPVAGSVFEDMPKTPLQEVVKLRSTCEETILQMHHCRQCRADAVGCL